MDFVHNEQGGTVVSGNMGIDMELMTDVREFSVTSNGSDKQGQQSRRERPFGASRLYCDSNR